MFEASINVVENDKKKREYEDKPQQPYELPYNHKKSTIVLDFTCNYNY